MKSFAFYTEYTELRNTGEVREMKESFLSQEVLAFSFEILHFQVGDGLAPIIILTYLRIFPGKLYKSFSFHFFASLNIPE